jgi:two-component system, OmpR family, osmolarity sensor histidine kinase EnvZ
VFRSIYARFFLITVLPIVILQCILTYVFYERHWDNISKRLEEALISQIFLLTKLNGTINKHELQLYAKDLGFQISPALQKMRANDKNLLETARGIEEKIQKKVESIYYISKSEIYVSILTEPHNLNLIFSYKKIASPTTFVFFIWMITASFLLMIIALLFMRNQIRAILDLAKFAEKVGKGQDMENFKIRGAKEIRTVANAFLKMKQRIHRMIYFRTELLAHISHDLRTPLTRIRLASEFCSDQQIAHDINKDVAYMEGIIKEYLEFAKGEGNEAVTEFDILQEIKAMINKIDNPKISFQATVPSLQVLLRKYSIHRALGNIIENALKFCKNKVDLEFKKTQSSWYFIVSDDGNGIPPKYYSKVFRPFFKIDKASQGFGLGLSSVKSIVLSHGGKIKLSKSKYGGLKVTIKIPL